MDALCLNGGECQDALSQVEVDALCKNGGECQEPRNSHQCKCKRGYDGSYCEIQINECSASPCRNGATCRDLIGEYKCDCPPGFQVRTPH